MSELWYVLNGNSEQKNVLTVKNYHIIKDLQKQTSLNNDCFVVYLKLATQLFEPLLSKCTLKNNTKIKLSS